MATDCLSNFSQQMKLCWRCDSQPNTVQIEIGACAVVHIKLMKLECPNAGCCDTEDDPFMDAGVERE